MKPIAVYSGNNRKRLCYLNNAYDISYNKTTNALWTASFTLPYGDYKNKYCESMNFVELWDINSSNKDKYVGLFRIMPFESELSDSESKITYNLEHVLATLFDDTMLGWHEIGNLGVYTGTVLNYILSKQTVTRWILGGCDYNHQYLYGWQDENLLSALYSVPNSFIEDDYRWEFDTKNYPWTINLKRISNQAITDIRYGKNINGITKQTDPTNLTTRLYCYGYGQSDNKLNIRQVNNNLPYLDSPNISKYGIITRVWTDERFTHEESLLQSGKAMLKALEDPIISYEVDVAAIRQAADLEAGDMVRVAGDGVDLYTRVIEVSKDDVSGAPFSGKVILANKTSDIAQSVADLADRQRIATTYSQGAETLFADSLYDNADTNNPAELTFTVPDNAIHVNEILFSARLTPFRAYSKAIQGGGSSTQTSSSGGASSVTSQSGGDSTQTSSSGGSSQSSTSNGGNTSMSSSGGGGTSTSTFNGGGGSQTSSYDGTAESWMLSYDYGLGDVMSIRGDPPHSHGLVPHQHPHSHDVYVPEHSHYFTINDHYHDINIQSHRHTVDIPSHEHTVYVPSHEHRVDIPSHTHTTTLPDHTHDIQYGIYKGSSASTMEVKIDEVTIGVFTYSADNINIISYMSKNANGEVMRGRHTIRITPNTLTRVECTIQIRLFTNAHGAGQY